MTREKRKRESIQSPDGTVYAHYSMTSRNLEALKSDNSLHAIQPVPTLLTSSSSTLALLYRSPSCSPSYSPSSLAYQQASSRTCLVSAGVVVR